MRRILFRWRGITVWSYPAMLYIGLCVGTAAGNMAAHASGIDPFNTFVATLLLIAPTLAGARLLYVATHWNTYRNDRARIWDINEGGQAQYGGLFVAVPLSIPLLAVLRLPFAAFWDVGVITILVGMIFTRVGCFLNGCCAGRPSRFLGVRLPNVQGVWEPRIPTQLLEGTWALMILVTALSVWPLLPFDGALFLVVVGGYAAGRLILESAREHRPGLHGFTVHHALSLSMVLISAAVLTARWPK